MGKRKTCYELHVDGQMVARGDIDAIARLLGVSPGTAQRLSYRKTTPKWLKLTSLPILYDFDGQSLTANEIAERYFVDKRSVISAASNSHRLLNKPIKKHVYDTFIVSSETFESLRKDAKNAAGNSL